MARKIVGVTVGTSINPQVAIEKTAQAKQIAKNTSDIGRLSSEIVDVDSRLYESIIETNIGVSEYISTKVFPNDWELGGYDAYTGEKAKNDHTIRTNKKPVADTTTLEFIGIKTGRAIYAYFYDKNNAFIGRTNENYIVPSGSAFVAFVYGFPNDGTTVEEYGIDNLISDYSMKSESLYDKKAKTLTLISDVGAVLEIAETYFKQAYGENTNLVYDSEHGLFAPQVTSDNEGEEGYNSIVCSQFSQALIMGIPFEKSRYVNPNNHVSGWGYITDGTGEEYPHEMTVNDGPSNDYMIAKHQCKYAMDHGWAYTMSDIRKQVRAGDIVFYGLKGVQTWADVTHVAYVLHVGHDDGYMIVAESDDITTSYGKKVGVVIKRFLINDGKSGNYQFGARFPINASMYKPTIIISDGELEGRNTSYAIKQYNIKEQPIGMYTAILEGYFESTRIEIGVHYVDSGADTFDYSAGRVVKNGDRYAVTFYAYKPFDSVRIGSTANNNYKINNWCLVKGFYGMDWDLKF